ncbi:MAG: hypothetical protein MHMPM18_002888 [Marteilia pararefringens]
MTICSKYRLCCCTPYFLIVAAFLYALIFADYRLKVFLGAAFSLALSVYGASIGIAKSSIAISQTIAMTEWIKYRHLITILLSEACAVYGLILGIVILSRSNTVDKADWQNPLNSTASYRFLCAGFVCGICNLITGIGLGEIGGHLALAESKDPKLFFYFLTILIFIAIISLYGLVVGMMMIALGEFV